MSSTPPLLKTKQKKKSFHCKSPPPWLRVGYVLSDHMSLQGARLSPEEGGRRGILVWNSVIALKFEIKGKKKKGKKSLLQTFRLLRGVHSI